MEGNKIKKMFKNSILTSLFSLLLIAGSFQAKATENNGQPTIVETAVSNQAFSTLVAAVKAADLVGVLSSEGPFTVFAPTNDAFAKLPAGTVEYLVKPENKSKLTAVLTYHVVAGKLMAADVVKAITDGGGKATITTVQGGVLIATLEGNNVILTDANGQKAVITAVDINNSNGVIHVIDAVVIPKY
jgi:uncharacterized surface protein with fasciclin (FAS1) repeats